MAKKKSSRAKSKGRKGGKFAFWVTSIILILLIWGAVSLSSHYQSAEKPKKEQLAAIPKPAETKAPLPQATRPLPATEKENPKKETVPKETAPKEVSTSTKPTPAEPKTEPVTEEFAPPTLKNSLSHLEYPKITEQGYVTENKEGRYTFCYSNEDRQSRWVAYLLTATDMESSGTKRQDDFRPDFRVMAKGWQSAELSDYRGSGYDRGHLVPSADRNNSKEENSATFLLSNIAPQAKNLNRFAWNGLESEVRRLAKKYDTVYIATGGVLHNPTEKPLQKIGSGVTVPPSFFKALLIRYNGKYYAIGYLMPNKEDCDKDFSRYAVTVDALEGVTGLDFFNALDEVTQKSAESTIDKKFWFR